MDRQARILSACVGVFIFAVGTVLAFRPSHSTGSRANPPTAAAAPLPIASPGDGPVLIADSAATRRQFPQTGSPVTRTEIWQARRPVTRAEIAEQDGSLDGYQLLARIRQLWIRMSDETGVFVNGQYLGRLESLKAVRAVSIDEIRFRFSPENPHWLVVVTLLAPEG